MKELMKERRWCVRDKNKTPYMSYSSYGSALDRSTWLSYEEANALLQQYPDKFTGLGVYFSEREGTPNLCLCGIDIDALDHDATKPNPLAEEILSVFKGTYAERSPSKTGFHILFYVDMNHFPYDKQNYPFQKNNRKKGLEAYVGTTTNRYFTYSGDKLETHNSRITDQTEQFIGFLTTYMSKPQKKREKTTTTSRVRATNIDVPTFDIDKRIELIRKSPKKKQFEILFDIGDTSKFESDSEADFKLLCILVPWLEGNPEMLDRAYRQSALYKNGRKEKWDEKRADSTYGELTIGAAVDAVNNPYYSDDPYYATGDQVTPEDIVKMINDVYADEGNKDKVSVLPFACGLGKSTAISCKIAEVLQSEGTDGLIVVTDSVKRMYKYTAPTKTNLSSLKDYLDLHTDEISILESNTLQTEKNRQRSCRILIMSTQRYFQMLSREQIIEYTKWDKGKRPLILIDERPGVIESKRFTIRDLNEVAATLQSLQPRNNDYIEHDWCIEQWDKAIRVLKADDIKYRRKETKNQSTAYYFCRHNRQMIDDDERFDRFISANSFTFYENKNDLIGTIRAARRYLGDWGIVERSYANGKPVIRFYTLLDYTDKITDIGAKVIILDGTADISPEYESDMYDVRQSPACRRWLDRLHIHVVNYPTTREVVKKEDPTQLAEKIRDYAWRKNRGKNRRTVVFTYKAKEDNKKHLETELQTLFNNDKYPNNVDHFGAIRGENIYSDSSYIIQYGLLQYSRCAYMLYVLNADCDLTEKLAGMEEDRASDELKRLESSTQTEYIRNLLILTDIEQNLFRGCIRMSDNDEQMDYDIFCSIDKYVELRNMLELRYLSLHATIDTSESPPPEFKTLSNSYRKDKIPAVILQWLDNCKPGRQFTYQIIENETGIPANRISQVRNRHPEINDIFNAWYDEDESEYVKPKNPKKYSRKINMG